MPHLLSANLRLVIRERREALGMTQQEVAELVGTEPEFIGMVEGGRRRFDLDRLATLADALQFDKTQLCRLGLYERAPQLYRVLFGDGPPAFEADCPAPRQGRQSLN
jgi:transcriptional regulator with XRE-family HTH domain